MGGPETLGDARAVHSQNAQELGCAPKLAIIGANEFQNPLILAAKERGIETHVFAWEAGDVGEFSADVFHPISITEVEAIAEACREIGIDGVASIGSDLANIAVAGVAARLGLTANSVECVRKSTDKELMRRAFEERDDPSPRSLPVRAGDDAEALVREAGFSFPLIVKPSDRSGSRGITKLADLEGLAAAVERAQAESFANEALVEEFAEGREFSVEYISWQGQHRFLSVTEKFTTGAPGFIERGHLEPACITAAEEVAIRSVVEHALDSLGVEYGPSHSEVKLADDGSIKIIEIGSRMGGDCIGSHLVPLSTGYDFVGATIDVALGKEPSVPGELAADAADGVASVAEPDATTESISCHPERAKRVEGSHGPRTAAVRFVFGPEDLAVLEELRAEAPEHLDFVSDIHEPDHAITDSGSRYGFFIFSGDALEDIEKYLPEVNE